jgi:hypothetical protein
MKAWHHPPRVKLALHYAWPVYVPHAQRFSDQGIAGLPSSDNITRWNPFGTECVAHLPDENVPVGERKPALGATEFPDPGPAGCGTAFGPSGIGVSSGPIGPITPNTHEPPYLGLPSSMWRPFQPMPSMVMNEPDSFAKTSQVILAGTVRRG